MNIPFKKIAQWRVLRLAFGWACLALIAAWYPVLQKELLEIPDDFSYTAAVQSFDNFYNPATKSFTGERQSASTFSYKTISKGGNALKIENKFDVRTLAGDPIFSVSRIYSIDEHTRMHIATGGDHPREGYLFAPRMKGVAAQIPDKFDFTYWHVNYDAPALMEYQDNENLYGLPVYRYTARFTADQTRELAGVLPEVGKDRGIGLDVSLQLWVEPYTGSIIQYRDDTEAYYYDLKTKAKLYPWNRFHNQIAVESVVAQAKGITFLKEKVIFIEYIIPIILLLCGFALLFWGQMQRVFHGDDSEMGRKKSLVLPLIVALVVLAFAIGVTWTTVRINAQNAEAEFNASATRASTSLTERLTAYIDLLRGAHGLFDASNSVERGEWHNYVNSLNLQENYPGIQGLGFARHVTQESLKKYIAEVRKGGFPEFAITPAGTRDEYVPVTYIEPFDARNQRAFGYDMWSESTRRAAMAFARDSAEVGVSGVVTLKQENGVDTQNGFLMYEALYKPTIADRTPEERRSSLFGYAYGAFRMKDFIIGVFVNHPTQLGIEVFDAESISQAGASNLMYRSNQVPEYPAYERFEKVSFSNRTWVVRFTAPAGFASDSFRNILPWSIMLLGLILSAGSFLLVRNVNIRRFEAMKIAQEMTMDLSAEKARTEAILESAAEGIVVVDRNGEFIFFNKEAQRLLGQGPRKVRPEKWPQTYGIYHKSEDRPLAFDEIKVFSAMKGEIVVGDKMRVKRPDGSLISLRADASPVKKGTEVIGVVFTFLDVSREEEIDKMKTEFVSLASHQLRTPLTAINWYIELLLESKKPSLSEKQLELVQEVKNASTRMMTLVRSLLNVSRLEMGTFSIDPTEEDILSIARVVINEQQPSFDEKKQIFTFTHADSIPRIRVDKQLMHIIIQNLLSNASKYTPPGGKITLECVAVADKLMIRVSDNGLGIPKQQQQNIFKKLFRASNIRTLDVDGTGLGLYIVKTIIDEAGCSIDFTSAQGEGTTFIVTVPFSGMKARQGKKGLAQS